MNSRQIREELAKLKQNVAYKEAELERALKMEENQLKELVKEMGAHWRNACDKQDIPAIKLLLEKMRNIPQDATSWMVEVSLNIDTSDFGCIKELLLKYAMRVAIAKDNDVMLSMTLDIYLQSYGFNKINESINRSYGGGPSFWHAPLMDSLVNSSLKCANLLLQKGADPNAIYRISESLGSGRGRHALVKGTALIFAIQQNLTDVAKQLIDRGAYFDSRYTKCVKDSWDPDQTGCFYYVPSSDHFSHTLDYDLTPLKLAEKLGNQELVNYMHVVEVKNKTSLRY